MEEKKIAAVIDMAIERETEAFAFYQDLHQKVEDATAKETLQFLANEEKKHNNNGVARNDFSFIDVQCWFYK